MLLLLNNFDIPASSTNNPGVSSSSSSSRCSSVGEGAGGNNFGGLFGGVTSSSTPSPQPPSLLRSARAFTAPAPAALFSGSDGAGLDHLAGGHPHSDHHHGSASTSGTAPGAHAWPSAPRVVELPICAHSRGMSEPSSRRAEADRRLDAAAAAVSTASAKKAATTPNNNNDDDTEPKTTGSGSPSFSAKNSASSVSSSTSSASAAAAEDSIHNKNNDDNDDGGAGDDDNERFYHFEIRGAEAKRNIDPEKIKCMCHEVAVAAAMRSRRGTSHPSDISAQRVDFQNNDFCVFTQTVMRDILVAKHNKLTFWGSTHFCNTDDTVTKAIRQMTETDIGALLVMDRISLDIDGNNVISEEELRSSPESGAIKGIITERDYLRAVALGNVRWNTKVSEVMTDFEREPDALVSVTPDTSVLAAMEIMTEQRIRHIPCISPAAPDGSRGAKMEGMVSIGDVVKALMSEEREEVQICKDYINGMYD